MVHGGIATYLVPVTGKRGDDDLVVSFDNFGSLGFPLALEGSWGSSSFRGLQSWVATGWNSPNRFPLRVGVRTTPVKRIDLVRIVLTREAFTSVPGLAILCTT